jgi:hypothetical protein
MAVELRLGDVLDRLEIEDAGIVHQHLRRAERRITRYLGSVVRPEDEVR